MQLYIVHEAIVENTGGHASSINGKLEPPHQTINNIVHIQFFSSGHSDELWCFCYQCTICIITRLINRRLVAATIVSFYKHKNIPYTLPFTSFVIWVCNIYIINSKQGKKELNPRTNTDPITCTPNIDPPLFPQSAYGFFIGYSNSTKVIIYSEPNTHGIKISFIATLMNMI